MAKLTALLKAVSEGGDRDGEAEEDTTRKGTAECKGKGKGKDKVKRKVEGAAVEAMDEKLKRESTKGHCKS